MKALKARISRLEAQLKTPPGRWFDLAVWRAEWAAGALLAEQERRRLVEHPESAAEIRTYFGAWRQRLADLDAVEDLENPGP